VWGLLNKCGSSTSPARFHQFGILTNDGEKMAEIFLSYNRKNEDFMLRLKKDLQREGFSVWVDQTGLKRGSPGWKAKIQNEIERARCLVVVLSPEAKESRWVEREMSYAEAFGRPIFPVLAKGNKRTAVPIDLIVGR
jgi:hypothetical protein